VPVKLVDLMAAGPCAGMLRTHIVPLVAAFAMKRRQVKGAAFQTLSQIGIRYRESPLSQTLRGMPESAPRQVIAFPGSA
jgi:hypothetical protein